MTNELERNRSKEPVTIRLDPAVRASLAELAQKEGRSVSALIDLAVREMLDRRAVGGGLQAQPERLKVKYASLPDTAVLFSFQQMAKSRFDEVSAAAGLPALEFSQRRSDWRSLPTDVFSGEADLVESVNWLPIFWNMRRGGSSTRLDWIGPYLQVFVGHCVFVRCDYLLESGSLTPDDLKAFLAFRNVAGMAGRDLSLRSLAAWVAQTPDGQERQRLATNLAQTWEGVVVGCQTGTDFHVAVKRVAPILANLSGTSSNTHGEHPRDAIIQGVENLDRGYEDFRNGTLTGFIGNLLQAAELLAEDPPSAILLAGPADLRVPSLNTLAGRKGMFDPNDPSSELGRAALALWGEAVRWFRDEVVGSESTAPLKKLVTDQFAGSNDRSFEATGDIDRKIEILRSLMQTWVRWFENPEEAKSFISDDEAIPGPRSTYTFEDLVVYYQDLCELLNPIATMAAPDYSSAREIALWKFPILADRVGAAASSARRRDRAAGQV